MSIYKINLANLGEASSQEVFDQVVAHLRKQGEKSQDAEGKMCMYRGGEEGNLMCAAGCLIADSEYKTEMDYDADDMLGESWDNLIHRGLVPAYHQRLIQRLQNVHDTGNDWEAGFKGVAGAFSIEYREKNQ